MTADLWPWATLVALGAFHGINPAMGWLFAVSHGLQEGRRGAVCRSLMPIALGHAAAVAAVVGLALAVAWASGVLVPDLDTRAVQRFAAAALVAFGLMRLVRGVRHRARVGMRVGFRDLTFWSFLMAMGHGAGLMVVPVILAVPAVAAICSASRSSADVTATIAGSVAHSLLGVGLHALAALVVTGAVALAVFEWFGLALLRRLWINLDLLWALSLIVVGGVLLVPVGG